MVAALGLSWATKRMVEAVRLGRAFASRARGLALGLTAAVPVALVSTHLAPVPAVSQAPLAVEEHPGAAAVAGDAQAVVSSLETALPRRITPKQISIATTNRAARWPSPRRARSPANLATSTTPPSRWPWSVTPSAGQWLPALEVIAAERNWRIVTYLRSRCPWSQSPTTVGDDPSPYTLCHEWGRDVLDRLTAQPPDLLVTADRPVVGSRASNPGCHVVRRHWPRNGRLLGTHARPRYQRHSNPGDSEMGIDVPDCLSTRGADLTDCGRPAATALAAEAPTIQATRTTDGRVGLVDMTDLLCPDAMCAPSWATSSSTGTLITSLAATRHPGLLSGGAPSGRRTPGLSRPRA